MNGGLIGLAVYIALTGALVWVAMRGIRTGAFPILPGQAQNANPAGAFWLFVQVIFLFVAAITAYPLLVTYGVIVE